MSSLKASKPPILPLSLLTSTSSGTALPPLTSSVNSLKLGSGSPVIENKLNAPFCITTASPVPIKTSFSPFGPSSVSMSISSDKSRIALSRSL